MSYVVRYHPDVPKRDLVKIPSNPRDRIRKAIEQRLTIDPTRYGDRLRKDLAGAWNLRVGDYRIVFDIDATHSSIYILVIAHRKRVYDMVFKRRASSSER